MLLAGKRLLALLMTMLIVITALPMTALSEDIVVDPTPVVEEPVEATEEPTSEPTQEPTAEPTVEPTAEPTTEPTAEPTSEPTVEPTVEPTTEPTAEPTSEPTVEPTVEPTTEPTAEPTSEPTVEPTPVLVSEIVFDPASAELYEDTSIAIKAVVIPENAADTSISWASSDETVATVDASGVVTAHAAGQAVITATANDMSGVYAQCAVTVLDNIASLEIDGVNRMQAGVEYQLTAMSGDISLDAGKVTWSSSDERIATVDANGIVVGVEVGEVVITAAANDASGLTAEIAVEVIPATVYIETSSNKDFSKAVSKNNINVHKAVISKSKALSSSSEFALMRLVAEVNSGKEIDVSAYNPTTVIRNKDNRYVIQFSTEEETVAAYEYLCSLKKVKYVTPDSIVCVEEYDGSSAPAGMEGAQYTHYSWGVARMGADELNSNGNQPSGTVKVAIIDTGVSAHSFIGGKRMVGYDYVDNDSNPSDEHGHGTHVAGTVVDMTQALDVRVVAYRVLGSDGRGYTSDICDAIRDAADAGCKVLNLSLGGAYSTSGYNTYSSAIKYAISKGSTVCVASGNDNDNTKNYVPACIDVDGCIVVGNMTSSDKRYDDPTYGSNYGSSLDVIAPGTSIRSCNYLGGYTYKTGTSMATPHVAGACAAIILWTGITSPASVQSKLESLCVDLGASGWDMYYGHGIPILSSLASTNPAPVPGQPRLSANSITIGKSQTWQLTVSGNKGPITWSTADSNVATVSASGLVTAKKSIGSTAVFATVDGYTLQCIVNVVKPSISSSVTITASQTLKLKVNYTNKTAKWKSNKTSVVTVNSKGKITAKKAGTATITATVDGYKLKCKVTVKANAQSFPVGGNDDYGYGCTIAIRKVYYSGNKIYANAYLINNYYSLRVTKINKLGFEIWDAAKDVRLAKKTFKNVSVSVNPGKKKKVTLKFTGSATKKSKYDLRNTDIGFLWGDFTVNVR